MLLKFKCRININTFQYSNTVDQKVIAQLWEEEESWFVEISDCDG